MRQPLARLWLIRRAGRVQSRATKLRRFLQHTLSLFGWEDSMRSIPLLAATTVIVLGAAACGDGGGPDNAAPNASFTQVCTGLSCVFTDASTDSDGSIASRSWTFWR